MKRLINYVTKLRRFHSLTLKICSCSIFVVISINIFAQKNGFCATSPNIPNLLGANRALLNSVSNTYTIGIFFHVMRLSNGTGGQTQQEVNNAFNTLESDYQSYNLHFLLLGIDEIWNDNFYNQTNFCADNYCNTDLNGDGKFDVFSPNSHAHAIDIYLFANDRLNFGLAANIPGTALVIGGNSFNTNLASSHVLSHEMGHCLGLFHTFHGTDRVHEPVGCAEFVNGSNGTTCGDFVQDTPADPSRIFDCGTQNTCTWNCSSSFVDGNGDHYNPDTHLFMSYTFPNCMNHHTVGQMSRIFSTVANSPLLQNVLFQISGSSDLCTQGTFKINNLPIESIVTWSASPANIVSLQPNGSSVTLTKVGAGIVTLTATINSTSSVTKQISVGAPYYLGISAISNLNMIDASDFQVLPATGFYAYEGTLTLADGVGLATSYVWSFVSGTPGKPITWWPSGGMVDVAMKSSNIILVLKCTASNSCGSYSQYYTFTNGDILPLLLSPNPSSTQVEVSIPDATTNSAMSTSTEVQSNSSYSVTVIDSYGFTVYSAKVKDNKFNIPTSSFKNGIYAVVVSDGVNVYQKKLIVKH